ncbi:MAG: response regulator [Symploca sp. SIO2G7]|nr:response regulator [Symploca sp. SIO2G7]
MTKPVILCVDDEKDILQSLREQLIEAFGNAYVYEVAEDADEALEVINELTEDDMGVILIVSDWLMPGMKGDEFLIKVHQRFPKVVKILPPTARRLTPYSLNRC